MRVRLTFIYKRTLLFNYCVLRGVLLVASAGGVARVATFLSGAVVQGLFDSDFLSHVVFVGARNLVGDDEVELLLGEIGASYFYAHFVAQTVTGMGAAAYEAVVFLVKVVVVVGEVAHRDEAFTQVLLKLYV